MFLRCNATVLKKKGKISNEFLNQIKNMYHENGLILEQQYYKLGKYIISLL
jgi:hypothetical protein